MDEIHQDLQTLGLKPCATLAETKQAYRDLIMVWHPDRFPANSRLQQLAEEKTKQINLSYQRLNSHWAKSGVGLTRPERASPKTARTNQQRESSRTSPNPDYQREGPRQSRPADAKSEREDKSNCYSVPTTTGVLILLCTCLGSCLLASVVDGGFSPWKALSIALLVGISFYSLVKAKSDHPRLTIWNYLKTFATTTFWICVGIAFLAVWLLNTTDDRRPNT